MTAVTYGELLASGRDQLDAAAALPGSALHREAVAAAALVIGRLALTWRATWLPRGVCARFRVRG